MYYFEHQRAEMKTLKDEMYDLLKSMLANVPMDPVAAQKFVDRLDDLMDVKIDAAMDDMENKINKRGIYDPDY